MARALCAAFGRNRRCIAAFEIGNRFTGCDTVAEPLGDPGDGAIGAGGENRFTVWSRRDHALSNNLGAKPACLGDLGYNARRLGARGIHFDQAFDVAFFLTRALGSGRGDDRFRWCQQGAPDQDAAATDQQEDNNDSGE